MNIYFSGSIKGGRQLVERYHNFISLLKTYGTVLTEHIGDSNYAKNGYKNCVEVYKEDVSFLTDSKVVIADVTVPSLGVGYELAFAEKLSIPCLCLCEKGANLSSMIEGNKYFTCYYYENEQHAMQIIQQYMQSLEG